MINFVLGKSGSGKTTDILNKMIELEQSGQSVVFLVPEQYSLQAERDILQNKRYDTNATTKTTTIKATSINVLSFGRLAYRVFSAIGLKNKTILDEVSLSMLLRKILMDVSDQLVYYKKTKITTGFISKLAVTIAQIEAGYLTEKVMQNLIERGDNLSYKTRDIFTIYKEFVKQEKYISTEQALAILSDKIKDSDLIKKSHVFIDGFSSFSTHEHRVIENLLKTAKTLTIAFTIDEQTAKQKDIDETNVFFETKNTFDKIAKTAVQSATNHLEKLYLKQNLRHEQNLELLDLEQNLFNFRHKYNNPTEKITLTGYENLYKEITATASSIIELVENQSYHYYDIAVLAPDDYATAIKNIFLEYGIPFFMDETGDISSHPLVNTMMSAISAVVYNWSREDIFSFLKSGLTNIEKDHIDLLENYVLAYNIKGYKWRLEQWEYPPFFSFDQDLDLINETKNRVVDILDMFDQAIKEKNVEQKVIGLFEAMTNSHILKNYQTNIQEDENIQRQKDDLLIYNKLSALLQIMVDFLGSEQFKPKDFLTILEAGIEATSRGKVPENIDSLIIASQGRSRLPDIKAIFVLGAKGQIGEDNSLYTDTQKATLKSYGGSFPSSRDKVFENNFSVYSYFTKPSDYLHISYAVSDLTGQTLGVSPLVSILKSKNISEKNTVIRYTEKIKTRTQSILNYTNDQQGFDKNYILSEESLSKLYQKDIDISVSRLEKYATCPFSYFVTYNLFAQERKIFELTNINYGDIFHNWLESFMKQAKDQNLDFSTIAKKDIYSFLQVFTDKLSKEYLFETNRDKFTLKKLTDIAVTSIWAMCKQAVAGSFDFYDAEISFGKSKTNDNLLRSIVIDIDGTNKFVLSGKIDRIDMFHTDKDGKEHSYVKIIDYKSSSKSLDLEEVKKGLQLQLLTYMHSVLDQGQAFGIEGEVLPGGILYFAMNNPWIGETHMGKADLETEILKKFTMSGLVLNEPNIISAFDSHDAKVISDRKGRISLDDFHTYMKASEDSIKAIGRYILDGNITPTPFKHGDKTGCDYCHYRSICNFDEKRNKHNGLKLY